MRGWKLVGDFLVDGAAICHWLTRLNRPKIPAQSGTVRNGRWATGAAGRYGELFERSFSCPSNYTRDFRICYFTLLSGLSPPDWLGNYTQPTFEKPFLTLYSTSYTIMLSRAALVSRIGIESLNSQFLNGLLTLAISCSTNGRPIFPDYYHQER